MKKISFTTEELTKIGELEYKIQDFYNIEVIDNDKATSITFKIKDGGYESSFHKLGEKDFRLYQDGQFYEKTSLDDILNSYLNEFKEMKRNED